MVISKYLKALSMTIISALIIILLVQTLLPTSLYRDSWGYSSYYLTKSIVQTGYPQLEYNPYIAKYYGKPFLMLQKNILFTDTLTSVMQIISLISLNLFFDLFPLPLLFLIVSIYLFSKSIFGSRFALYSVLFVIFTQMTNPFYGKTSMSVPYGMFVWCFILLILYSFKKYEVTGNILFLVTGSVFVLASFYLHGAGAFNIAFLLMGIFLSYTYYIIRTKKSDNKRVIIISYSLFLSLLSFFWSTYNFPAFRLFISTVANSYKIYAIPLIFVISGFIIFKTKKHLSLDKTAKSVIRILETHIFVLSIGLFVFGLSALIIYFQWFATYSFTSNNLYTQSDYFFRYFMWFGFLFLGTVPLLIFLLKGIFDIKNQKNTLILYALIFYSACFFIGYLSSGTQYLLFRSFDSLWITLIMVVSYLAVSIKDNNKRHLFLTVIAILWMLNWVVYLNNPSTQYDSISITDKASADWVKDNIPDDSIMMADVKYGGLYFAYSGKHNIFRFSDTDANNFLYTTSNDELSKILDEQNIDFFVLSKQWETLTFIPLDYYLKPLNHEEYIKFNDYNGADLVYNNKEAMIYSVK